MTLNTCHCHCCRSQGRKDFLIQHINNEAITSAEQRGFDRAVEMLITTEGKRVLSNYCPENTCRWLTEKKKEIWK